MKHTCNPRTREAEARGSWGSLATSPPNLACELWLNKRTCLKGFGWGFEESGGSLHIHEHTCTLGHTQAHMHRCARTHAPPEFFSGKCEH